RNCRNCKVLWPRRLAMFVQRLSGFVLLLTGLWYNPRRYEPCRRGRGLVGTRGPAVRSATELLDRARAAEYGGVGVAAGLPTSCHPAFRTWWRVLAGWSGQQQRNGL